MYKLKDIPLFSTLTEAQLSELPISVRHYSKGSILFYEGDESEYLHILLDGKVRLYKTTPKGNEIHMHHFEAPETIALFAAFEEIPFPASCAFVEEGAVGLLPLKKIHNCLHDVKFSLALITSLTRRMKLLANLLHKETIYSSEAKIADLIYTNASVFERLKNNEIASILNMTPETLSRILSRFKKENIISIKEHLLTILDQEALIDIISTNKIQKITSI